MKKRLLIFTAALFFAIGLIGGIVFAGKNSINPVIITCDSMWQGRPEAWCWLNNQNIIYENKVFNSATVCCFNIWV